VSPSPDVRWPLFVRHPTPLLRLLLLRRRRRLLLLLLLLLAVAELTFCFRRYTSLVGPCSEPAVGPHGKEKRFGLA